MGKLLNPTTGFWQNLEGETPNLPATITNNQLSAPVSVVWDENMVPHIYAENEDDVYFVQGFITAQMRLWQMDFQTRAAAGRISEIVGKTALDYDKSMRRKGMLMGAQKNTDGLIASEYKSVFDNYTAGVNAYINTLDDAQLPLEYKLLAMTPEPWTNFKTMLLQEYLINMLNSFNHDVEYSRFLDQYGYDQWALLYGGLDLNEDPIVDNPGGWDFEPMPKTHLPTDVVQATADLKNNVNPDPNNGSNNWAISPERSATGNALLANDPHLKLNLPSLWFAVHLHAPNLNVMGASLPGAPSVIIGFNKNVAWGYTNAQRDMVDWYKVQFSDASKTAILVDGKPIPVDIMVQEFNVRGGETVRDTLRYSPFGIIANYSAIPTEQNTGWAYRWIGQDENMTSLSFIKMNHAASFNDYLNATNHMTAPGQNVVFADVSGNIALRIQGQYLNRAPNEGLFLRDGTTEQNQWDYIPLEQNILSKNPDRGFVSSANQYPADSTYPYFIAATRYEVYRNRRINAVLRADTLVSVDDIKALHHDNFNMEAAENLTYFLAALDYNKLNEQEKRVFEMLMNWNYVSNPELEAPVYYDEWRNFILKKAWDELTATEEEMAIPNKYRTFKLLKDRPNLTWWDVQSTKEVEDAQGLIRASFNAMMTTIENWKKDHSETKLALNWGNYKNTHVTHLTRQKELSEPVFVGGNLGIVNATSATHGPSWRQIVDLDPNGTKAWVIYPGGQSGNPGSQYYVNMVKPWADGAYLPYNLSRGIDYYIPNATQITSFTK